MNCRLCPSVTLNLAVPDPAVHCPMDASASEVRARVVFSTDFACAACKMASSHHGN